MSQRKLISFRAKCKDKVKEDGDDTTVEVQYSHILNLLKINFIAHQLFIVRKKLKHT